jgi:hypothetical protein
MARHSGGFVNGDFAMASLGGVDWVLLDRTAGAAVQVGDLVSADAGCMPIYRVIALEDDRAWLRDSQHDIVRVLPLSVFHWKAAPPN